MVKDIKSSRMRWDRHEGRANHHTHFIRPVPLSVRRRFSGPNPLQLTGGTRCLCSDFIGNLFYGSESNFFSLFYSFGTSYREIVLMLIGERWRCIVLRSKSKNGVCTDIEVWNANMFIRGLRWVEQLGSEQLSERSLIDLKFESWEWMLNIRKVSQGWKMIRGWECLST